MNSILKKIVTACSAILCSIAATSAVDYSAWPNSGSMFILTTPEGANLPTGASESDFPLLVRLNSRNFNFAQAKTDGSDIRFAIQGAGTVTNPATALSYEIEQWDAVNKLAAIWVKIPLIKGNERQELKMYWGNTAAVSASDGKAVFSNNYAAVFHLSQAGLVQDTTGTITTNITDSGTTQSNGIIGKSRYFSSGKKITCSNVTAFPVGNSAQTGQAWVRIEAGNIGVMGWGEWAGGGQMADMGIGSAPVRAGTDSNHGALSIDGTTTLALSQWAHVVCTYDGTTGRLYVNGVLDGTDSGTQNMPNPTTLRIGHTSTGRSCLGDVDEVRISKVARSANWVKLEFENQKPVQTLLGPLVQSGSSFSVTPATVTMNEGNTTTLTGQAGGAQKLYWSRIDNSVETLLAADQFTYDITAERITSNRAYTLRFKAIYPAEVKTVDVPVTINEFLPDPIFTLNAPATWNGRDTISVTPTITNLADMQAKGVGNVTYSWKAIGVAVTKSVAPGALTLTRSQGSGVLTVALTMANGGSPVTRTATIFVREPTTPDPWVTRTPGTDEKPVNGQFFARDSDGTGKLFYNGTLPASAATSVFLNIYTTDTGSDVLFRRYTSPLTGRSYAFTAPLNPGKVTYKAVFGSILNGVDTVLSTVTDLVCGDVYIIEGQSNAVANADLPRETSTSKWIRTYEGNNWGYARRSDDNFGIGYWGKDLAEKLLATYNMPICIINGAWGGTRIDVHLPNPTDRRLPLSSEWGGNIYANLLKAVEGAKLTHGIRAVIWHQGEQNQGAGGPDGDFDYKFYQQYFVDLSAEWKKDFPNLSHYYIFQIWPNACGDTSANNQLREVQRTLPRLFANMRIMSTLGIAPGSSCHYPALGYKQFAVLMSPLIEKDFYGLVPGAAITAPDVQRAYYTTAAKNEIALEFGQTMAAWSNASNRYIYLDGVKGKVTSGSVNGNVITLQLNAASTASTITYIKDGDYDWDATANAIRYLLKGTNGIAALTFADVPIQPPGPLAPSNLTATAASTTQINLAWTDNSNNETGFKVERATVAGGPFSPLTTTGANVTTYNSTGLTAATQYFYRVMATNAAGDSTAVTANATTEGGTAPAAPTNLTATVISTTQINLAWTDNSNNETGFKVEQATVAGGPFTLLTTTTANTFNSTGLTASTPYFFRVSATNAVGDSSAVTVNATTSTDGGGSGSSGDGGGDSGCGLGATSAMLLLMLALMLMLARRI